MLFYVFKLHFLIFILYWNVIQTLEWDKNVAFKHTQLKEEEDGEDGSGKEKFLNQLKAAAAGESIIYDDDSEGENYEKVKLFDEEWEKALFRIAYIKPPIRKKLKIFQDFELSL